MVGEEWIFLTSSRTDRSALRGKVWVPVLLNRGMDGREYTRLGGVGASVRLSLEHGVEARA